MDNDDGPGLTMREIEREAADRAKIKAFDKALRDLANEDTRFTSNRNIYNRWDDEHRLWWIARVTADAEAGKDTIGAQVVTRVVMNRLAG